MAFAAGSALLWLAAAAPSQPFAKTLAGKRLIMKDSTCAGLAFRAKDRVDLYSEMGCVDLEARLRWLGPDTFVISETERINKDCPPRNWIYKVESLRGNTVRLRSVWTGWNDFRDSVSEYQVSALEELEP